MENLDEFIWIENLGEYHHESDVTECPECSGLFLEEDNFHSDITEEDYCCEECRKNILCEYEEKNISVESGNKLLAGGELHELDGILYDIIDEETGLPYAYEMNEMTV